MRSIKSNLRSVGIQNRHRPSLASAQTAPIGACAFSFIEMPALVFDDENTAVGQHGDEIGIELLRAAVGARTRSFFFDVSDPKPHLIHGDRDKAAQSNSSPLGFKSPIK